MRFSLAALLVLGLTTEIFGQLPVVPVAGQPFSADEVIVENPKPNVPNELPRKTIRVYRDSDGRTRTDDSTPPDPIAPFVYIYDPIGNVQSGHQ